MRPTFPPRDAPHASKGRALRAASVAAAVLFGAPSLGCADSVDDAAVVGAGGAGGAASVGGAGGAGGTTTTPSTTSTTTTSAGGAGGAGTPACAGAFELTNAACRDCLEASCCDALAACAKNAACASCVTTGDAADCAKAQALAGAVASCNAAKCKQACTPEPPPVDCGAPTDVAKTKSGGACIAIDKELVACNPVTQEGCDTKGGHACDVQTIGGELGFQCYPGANDVALCGDCDAKDGPFCAPGTSCDGGRCARFCCEDGDCGPGATCEKAAFQPTYEVGVCRAAAAAKDAGP